MSRISFFKYITRPSGMGANPRAAWVIPFAALGMAVAPLWYHDVGKGFMTVFGVCLFVAFWWATYRNWIRDRDGLPSNPNHHMSDVIGEGTEFPVMREPYGAPIKDIVQWYAAVHEVGYSKAIDAIATDCVHWHNRYCAYLSDKRFDKFRK